MSKEVEKRSPNKNGANQYKPDPRQALFLSYYLDPKSETFSNALRSALRAGYEEYYASNITVQMPTWLQENISDTYIVQRAEQNLKEFVEQDHQGDPKWGKIKADMTKFALERLKKEKYAARNEHTGKGGQELEFVVKKFE